VNVVDRARADLSRGEPWLARDRLRGALAQRPHDQNVIEELALVHSAMGDLPAAGACWFLTGRADGDPQVAAALAAFERRYPKPWVRAVELPLTGGLDAYPDAAWTRVLALQQACREEGWHWEPRLRPRLLDDGRQRRLDRPTQEPARRARGAFEVAGVATVVLANIGIYVFGLVMLIRAIWS
jgi:hypothetical protein